MRCDETSNGEQMRMQELTTVSCYVVKSSPGRELSLEFKPRELLVLLHQNAWFHNYHNRKHVPVL
jgi:hypothetical protein